LTFYDDTSAPEQCIVLTERLITEEQIDSLLGPYSGDLALRAAEVAQRSKRVQQYASAGPASCAQRHHRQAAGGTPADVASPHGGGAG